MSQLDAAIDREVKKHYQLGAAQHDAGNCQAALDEYQKALRLLPEPIEQWEASTWVLMAIGDCEFQLGDYQRAHYYLSRAMYCPGALGDPFIHLRLGQTQLELGNEERAKDELARAYMGGGKEIFADEDPKYYQFIKRFMRGL